MASHSTVETPDTETANIADRTTCYSPKKQKVLLLCDSRGLGLKDALAEHMTDIEYKVLAYPGAPIGKVISYSKNYIIKYKPTHVYNLAGICDVTIKETGKVRLARDDIESASAYIESEICEAENDVASLVEHELKYIHAPITGMYIAAYNSRKSKKRKRGAETPEVKETASSDGEKVEYTEEQNQLNDIIIATNKKIAAFNERNKMETPWTSSIIHKSDSNGFRHEYRKLKPDGCHLTEEVRNFWARELADVVKKNCTDCLHNPCQN